MKWLAYIAAIVPFGLFAQGVQFSEVIDGGNRWIVEVHVSEWEEDDAFEMRSKQGTYPIVIANNPTYQTFLIPKSDGFLRGQEGVFSPYHPEVLLFKNGENVDRFPERCIPNGGSQLKYEGEWKYTAEATPQLENSDEWLNMQEQMVNLNVDGGYFDYRPVLDYDGILYPNSEIKWNDGSVELSAESANLEAHVFPFDAPNAELSYIEASGYQIPPLGDIHTAIVRQFQVYQEGCPVGPVLRKTFFLGDGENSHYQLPVVSINTADDNLFSDDGIYGYGPSGINFDYRGKDWERPATVEYFENGQLKLSQNIGLRIRGKSSRYSPQKSFKLYAREEYGTKKFENVFFPELGDNKLKRLNLRTPHNDFIRSMAADHLASKLVEDLDIDAPMSERCVLYVNGEYWGLYTLQESMDNHYPETRYGVNDDNVLEVDNDRAFPLAYQEIIDFVTPKNNLSDEDMSWLAERVDINSIQDYYAAQILFANWDWPQKNVKAWLSTEEDVPLRYFFFDCDACFQRIDHEGIQRFYPERNTDDHSVLFSTLMTHKGFRDGFFETYLGLLKGPLGTQHLLEAVNEAHDEIEPYIDQHIMRWGYPQSRSAWESSVESIELFSIRRSAEVLDDIEEILGGNVNVYPNPAKSGEIIHLSSFGLLDKSFVYTIYDLSGKRIQTGTGLGGSIELRDLDPGQYFLSMSSDGFVFRSYFSVL